MGNTRIGGILLAIFATLSAIDPTQLPPALGPVAEIVKAATAGLGTLLSVFGLRNAVAKNGRGL